MTHCNKAWLRNKAHMWQALDHMFKAMLPQHIHDFHSISLISSDVASCGLPLLVKIYHYILWTLSIFCNMYLTTSWLSNRNRWPNSEWQTCGCATVMMQHGQTEGACHTSCCRGGSYLVCQCESGLGERPETLHLKLHLTDRRVKADAATSTQTMQLIHQLHNSQQKCTN